MLVIKLTLNDDTRRLTLDSAPSYDVLSALTRNLFNLDHDNVKFFYKDEEGDVIKVGSAIELEEAVRQVVSGEGKTQILRLAVRVQQQDSSVVVPAVAPEPEQAKPAPLPSSVLVASSLRTSQITRDLNFLTTLEAQLANVFRNISSFMHGDYAMKDKIVNLVHDCSQAIGKVSSNVDAHVLKPIANFTTVHASSFQAEMQTLKDEISKLRNQLQDELTKVGEAHQGRKNEGKSYFAPLLALQHLAPKVEDPVAAAPATNEDAPVVDPEGGDVSALSDHEISRLLQHFQMLSDTPDEDEKAPAGTPIPEKYQTGVQTLTDMGFMDAGRNVKMLEKYSGDVSRVVDAYLGN